MNYQQHLSSALVLFGEGDENAALLEFQAALDEARKVDADGPREAEVLNYVAQVQMQRGHAAEAVQALEKVVAVYERFPEFAEGLRDYYLQLMRLCLDLGQQAAAQSWRDKAKEMPESGAARR